MKERIARIAEATPKRYDMILLGPVLFLVSIGIITVFSASGISAAENLGSATHYLNRQILWVVIGIGLGLTAAHLPYPWLATLAPLMLLGAAGLLAAVHIPGIGATRGGATRWIDLGSISFQPSEVAKLAVVFYLARYYATRKNLNSFTESIGKPALLCAPLVLMIGLQPDYGTAAAITLLFGVMAWTAGAPMRHLVLASATVGPAFVATAVLAPYRLRRLTAFLDPWNDMSDAGFQIIQSFLAFARGGVTGRGLGNGMQKLYYLPEAHSDFVLASIGEELGVIGVLTVLLAFALLVGRGLAIALWHGDALGRLLAAGLSALVGLQVIVNASVVTGLLPTKGITLPLVSYGGSSLLATMAAIGVLMNISACMPPQRNEEAIP